MVEIIQAQNLTLLDLVEKFNLHFVEDDQFFQTLQDDLPKVSEFERQILDRVKASYFNLLMYPPMLETTVKMVVLYPLLLLAGFYLPPFHIKAEPEVQISVEDEDTIVKANIDVLVLQQRFWLLIIESKRAEFSLEVGLAQIIAYMLANPNSDKPTLGMLTNGRNFQFIKLTKENTPLYTLSKSFDIRNPGNELYTILSILKRLAQQLLETG